MGKMAEQIENSTGEIVAKLETPASIRIGEIVFASLLSLLIFALGLGCLAISVLLLTKSLGNTFEQSSEIYAHATLLAAALLLLWAWWAALRARLRFTLYVTPESLQFGRGIFASTIRCDQVESIRLVEVDSVRNSYNLRICGGGKNWIAHFGRRSRDYAHVLRHYCRNAIYIDDDGAEHLSASPGDPVLVIRHLVRALRKRGMASLVGGLVLLACSAPLFVLIIHHRLTEGPDPENPIEFGIFVGLLSVMGFLTLAYGIQCLRKARKAIARAHQHLGGSASTLLSGMEGQPASPDKLAKLLDDIAKDTRR